MSTTTKTEMFPWEDFRDRDEYWDFQMPGSQVPLPLEAAYRRGYHQGAHAAAEAIQRGTPLSAVLHWAGVTLHKWRHSWRKPGWTVRKLVKVVAPPDPPYPKGRELR